MAGTAGRAAPTRPGVPGSGSRELPLPRGKSSGSFWEVAPAAGTGLGTARDPRAARPRLLLGAITFWACLTLTPGEDQSSHTPQVPVPSLWASSGSGDMSPTRLHGPGTVVVPAPLPELSHPDPAGRPFLFAAHGFGRGVTAWGGPPEGQGTAGHGEGQQIAQEQQGLALGLSPGTTALLGKQSEQNFASTVSLYLGLVFLAGSVATSKPTRGNSSILGLRGDSSRGSRAAGKGGAGNT